MKNVKPIPLHINCLVYPKSKPKPKVSQSVPAMTKIAKPIATITDPAFSVFGGMLMRNP